MKLKNKLIGFPDWTKRNAVSIFMEQININNGKNVFLFSLVKHKPPLLLLFLLCINVPASMLGVIVAGSCVFCLVVWGFF